MSQKIYTNEINDKYSNFLRLKNQENPCKNGEDEASILFIQLLQIFRKLTQGC